MSAGLAIEGLSVRYGEIAALARVALEVAPGEAVALLGANGAGKSTVLNAVIGLVPAVAGTIRLDGAALDALATPARARRGLGYCPEGRRVFPGMTVHENLAVASRAPARRCAQLIERLFALFPDLAAKARERAWQLSGGQQQMLAIARALMTEPRVLLLDEPSLGLAPVLARAMLGHVRAIASSGTAVLLAEQNAAGALAVTQRAYVLQVGRIVASGPSASLRNDPAVRAAFLGG